MQNTRSITDQELVRLARAGSRSALEAIYERYLPSLWRYVHAQVRGNRADAEDIVSETFLAAVQNLGKLEPDTPSVYAWLVGIARHKSADHWRRRQRSPGDRGEELLDPPDRGGAAAPSRQLEVAEGRRQVAATMARLPDQERLVLEWKYVDELSVREIAQRIGRTEKAVEDLLYRARKLFQETFPSRNPDD